MRRSVLVGSLITAVVVALTGPGSAVASPAGARPPSTNVTTGAAAPVLQHWYAGVQAGTTTFGNGTDATCKPKLGTRPTDSRCYVRISGKFAATDQPYHGTYSGWAYLRYLDPKNSNYAAWETSSVTYVIRDSAGRLLSTVSAAIDSGTGGVFGYPYDLSISYTIELRNEPANFLERMSGVGVNQLDPNLKPIRTFIDRIGFQNGI